MESSEESVPNVDSDDASQYTEAAYAEARRKWRIKEQEEALALDMEEAEKRGVPLEVVQAEQKALAEAQLAQMDTDNKAYERWAATPDDFKVFSTDYDWEKMIKDGEKLRRERESGEK